MKRILFRSDGGVIPETGTGHIRRSLLLAKAFSEFEIHFCSLDLEEYRYGREIIAKEGFPLHLLSSDQYHSDLTELIKRIHPDFIVCDKLKYELEELRRLKEWGTPLMTFDHFDEHRSLSDYPINAVREENTNSYSGLDYLVLPLQSEKAFRSVAENLFVCFGGFDALGITEKLMKSLAEIHLPLTTDVIVGGGYQNLPDLSRICRGSRNEIRLHQEPENFMELLAGADIACVSGGLIFYQVVSLGLASVVICQYEHQLEQVGTLLDRKVCKLLGKGDSLDYREVIGVVCDMIGDSDERHTLYMNGRRLIDGKGLNRVAEIVRRRLGT